MSLAHRIAEERMIALDPPFVAPDWLYRVMGDNEVPHAIFMDAAGGVAPRRVLIDEIYWPDVAAVRLEDRWGNPIDPLACDDEMDGWD